MILETLEGNTQTEDDKQKWEIMAVLFLLRNPWPTFFLEAQILVHACVGVCIWFRKRERERIRVVI